MASGLPGHLQAAAFAQELSEQQLLVFAQDFASLLVRGDCVALRGDLGAGKTTFARAVVRALLRDPTHEVPSPTFALRQDYSAALSDVAHFDLYRLTDPRELDELGFDEALAGRIVLLEWPERAEAHLPADRFEVQFSTGSRPDLRHLSLTGHGRAGKRAAQLAHPGSHIPR
jgi:tRNA threonylcarbamoyl adenosine modification protein YjeE